jgi:hypothetical protein
MTEQHTPDMHGNGLSLSARGGASALEHMAVLLAEGLARHSIQDQWNDLDEGDRHSLMAVCEWLLMDWDLLVRVRNERVSRE